MFRHDILRLSFAKATKPCSTCPCHCPFVVRQRHSVASGLDVLNFAVERSKIAQCRWCSQVTVFPISMLMGQTLLKFDTHMCKVDEVRRSKAQNILNSALANQNLLKFDTHSSRIAQAR